MNELDDAALVARAKTELPHRTGAFEALMRRHGGRIRAVTRRFAASSADAEDLAQEVMLKVFFELPRFRGEAAFTTWLWRLAANLCIDHQRRLDGRQAASSWPGANQRHEFEDPHDSIAAAEARLDAEKLLRFLTPEDRMLVLLHLAVGLEFREVAATMGLGLSAVKMRYARAMDRLKALAGISSNTASTQPVKQVAPHVPCASTEVPRPPLLPG
ncbi:MAG: sigma-70 family RNA polymerase sigma factor [Acidobacteriota bacterium]